MLCVSIMVLLGILLYVGGSKLIVWLPSENKTQPKGLVAENTGKENLPIPAVDILLPDSITYLNIGKTNSLEATVIFYLSPDCPYCQAEIREIITHIDKLRFIQFYLITPYPFDDMKNFYDKFELSKYSNIQIGRDTKFVLGSYFRINSVPFLAVYGRNRKLTEAHLGNLKADQIKIIAEK